MNSHGSNVGAHATAEEAVPGADVALALTSSPQPILEEKWLSPHAMVCAIGAATPDRRELDQEAMRGAVVVVIFVKFDKIRSFLAFWGIGSAAFSF
jgi:ornithine cyclodeaminase/alanine dehydrogenase-like protein (mu-crystallin family)